MSDSPRDEERLQADLGQLRSALRALAVPAPDEPALREQFRAARRRRGEASAPRPAPLRRLGLAAAVLLAVGGVIAAVVLGTMGPQPEPLALDVPEVPAVPGNAFQALPNAPGLMSASAYSVVRVRIPLAAFAIVPGTAADGMVEADLLVGEDGLARAIRFNEVDAQRVSVAQQ